MHLAGRARHDGHGLARPSHHDDRVVTGLDPLELFELWELEELPVVDELVAELPELVPDELDTVVGVETVELTLAICLLSAGSWPVTSVSAMNSHTLTNSVAAPEITRRRIVRARPARASRAIRARSRAASRSGVIGVMVGSSWSLSVDSAPVRLTTTRINRVSGR